MYSIAPPPTPRSRKTGRSPRCLRSGTPASCRRRPPARAPQTPARDGRSSASRSPATPGRGHWSAPGSAGNGGRYGQGLYSSSRRVPCFSAGRVWGRKAMPTRHAIGRSFVHLFPQEIYRHFHSVPIPYSANTANLVFGCEGLGVPMMRLVTAAAILLIQGQPATASLLWNWSYSGAGVSASGTFTTNDTPDGAGLYQIVGITGTDNGATITGLQPTGTPIPGNEPYAVDNLVSAAEPRLTMHGF